MYVIPAVDVLDGAVVRLFQGDYDATTRYDGTPSDQVAAWMAAGSGLVHVIDLEGARSGAPTPGLWESVAGVGARIQIGGGIRTSDDAAAAVELGIDRVIMGTAAVWEPEILRDAIQATSVDAIVAAIDVRGDRAAGAGWLDEGQGMEDVVSNVLEVGVEMMLVTSVARDGTMSGPDLGLLRRVRRLAPDSHIIAAGGIASMGDLDRLAASGVDGAVVGRAIYEGGIDAAAALGRYPNS